MKHVDKYSVSAFVLWLASFVIYLNYYDILIPGIPDGSYRLAVGTLFVIPAFILSVGQLLIGAFIIFAAAYLFKGREHVTRSFFVSAVVVFLFSLTYVIFPMFGPFYYIVFATGIAPPHVLEVEIAWTLTILAVSTLLIAKMNKIKMHDALFTAAVTIIFIVVAAS